MSSLCGGRGTGDCVKDTVLGQAVEGGLATKSEEEEIRSEESKDIWLGITVGSDMAADQ